MADFWAIAGNFTLIALTFMVYSFPLIRENAFYRFVEYLFIGVTIGHATVVSVQYLQKNVIPTILAGSISYMILGLSILLLFSRFYRPYAYVSRWPMSILIGSMMGLQVFSSLNTSKASILACAFNPFAQSGLDAILGSVLIMVGLVTSVLYFTWGIEHEGVFKPMDKLARYFLMLWFGTSFGSIAMGRFTWLSGTIASVLHALGLF